MSFRRRLLIVLSLIVFFTVGAVSSRANFLILLFWVSVTYR